MLYPILLQPTYHIKVWGGRQLQTQLGKPLPTDDPYGEAWELHDSAIIGNGPLQGQTLGQALAKYGQQLIGAGNSIEDGMPLLAKFLDSSRWLSVQVHPNDAQAQQLESDPRGKTEAWIVLAAEPDAQLVIGVQPGTSREAMAEAIRKNRLEDLLVFANVQKGDVLFIPANTVHAIGPGLLIYEIQQSSNTTYRLYDWGRMGLDGTPRPLHIEKGVAVSNLEYLPKITRPETSQACSPLVHCPYFKTDLWQADGESHHITTDGKFHALSCIDGTLQIEANSTAVTLEVGQTVLIAADNPTYTLQGRGQALCSYQA